LYVIDHAIAIDAIFHHGKQGETYNIGGLNEWTNIDLIHLLCELMDEKLGRMKGSSATLISFVKDRPGHDKRYAIDATKLCNELKWKPSVDFKQGLSKTIDWYLDNSDWLERVASGAYKEN
jgi:dTDP-glucose 4,6-dehydratase